MEQPPHFPFEVSPYTHLSSCNLRVRSKKFQESPTGQLLPSVHEKGKETTSTLHKIRRWIIVEYSEIKARSHPMEIYIPSTYINGTSPRSHGDRSDVYQMIPLRHRRPWPKKFQSHHINSNSLRKWTQKRSIEMIPLKQKRSIEMIKGPTEQEKRYNQFTKPLTTQIFWRTTKFWGLTRTNLLAKVSIKKEV